MKAEQVNKAPVTVEEANREMRKVESELKKRLEDISSTKAKLRTVI